MAARLQKTAIIVIAIAVLALAARALVFGREPAAARRESYKLGTIVRIAAYGADKQKLDKSLDEAFAEITRLENLFSVNIASSDISSINKRGGADISPETGGLLAAALRLAEETSGAFDPTIGPVARLWGVGTENARVPSEDEIKKARALVDYKKVKIKPPRVAKGQRLDLGGIAKGYIADRLVEKLKKDGVESAIIDLGGNLCVIGKSPKGAKWKLGLQHPDKPRGEYFAALEAEDASVVTSGPYERFFEKDGARWHHIFDPKTGYPAKSDLSSVTVVSENSAEADALCTALFVMGLEKSKAFLRTRKTDAVLVSGKKVFITPGLKGSLSLKDTEMTLEAVSEAGQ